MEHEGFTVKGFEFMDEPATDDQKDIIVELCKNRGTPTNRDGKWPNPFTRWDASQMIAALKVGEDET
ncbi:MAG: hypothetical protein FVQ80_06835 [Planctomycetes bacterium]|nr:hypothetical protein [Planctomycetota bacterium]